MNLLSTGEPGIPVATEAQRGRGSSKNSLSQKPQITQISQTICLVHLMENVYHLQPF